MRWRGMLTAAAVLGGGFAIWSMQARIAALEARTGPRLHASSPKTVIVQTVEGEPVAVDDARIARLEAQVRDLEMQLEEAADQPAAAPAPTRPVASDLLTGEVLTALEGDFSRYDADQDEGLTAEELSVQPAELAAFDLNRDHQLTADEVERLRELSGNAQRAAHQWGDGFPITADAFKGDRRRFHFLDRNDDGEISESEYVASLSDAIREVRRFDLNHDGALTAAELWDAPTRLQRFDLDGDGVLYAWEVSRSMARAQW